MSNQSTYHKAVIKHGVMIVLMRRLQNIANDLSLLTDPLPYWHVKCLTCRVLGLYSYTRFFAFLVKKTSGILLFGPSFRKPARKASSGEIYLKNKDLYATDL